MRHTAMFIVPIALVVLPLGVACARHEALSVQDDRQESAARIAVEPVATLAFDPLGRDDPHLRATVFADLGFDWDSGQRPWVIVAAGGGWAPRSGTAAGKLTASESSLPWLLFEAGYALIYTGYTVFDPALPGAGLFHAENWARDTDTLALRLDPTKLEQRCAELDLVNLVQYVRAVGVPEVPDLDRRPGRGGMYARSAGAVDMNFVLLGADRAAMSGSERFTMSTRLGFGVAEQYLCSFAAYEPDLITFHHPNAEGRRAKSIGAATAVSIDETSALCYAFQTEAARRLAASTPVHLAGEGEIRGAGPYTYSAMRGLFRDLHPPENVVAMRDALLAAGLEFKDPTQSEHSAFVVNPLATRTKEQWARERLEWIQATVARLDAPLGEVQGK